jgi:hypothetical protein
MTKTYLGDGAFADFDGHQIVLTAENGIRVTNRICLEPAVWRALQGFAEEINKEFAAAGYSAKPF